MIRNQEAKETLKTNNLQIYKYCFAIQNCPKNMRREETRE
jgi:hypothetical protein